MRTADLASVVADYRLDRARWDASPRSAEVRARLDAVARTLSAAAEAVGDLCRDDRALLGLTAPDTHALHDHLLGLSRHAGDASTDLKVRSGRGGNRRLLGVLGAVPPRAELILRLRRDLPGASRSEILDAAAEVLTLCGEDDCGLEDVMRRLPQNREE